MRVPEWFGALSGRTLRVFVLTLLLTAVACECNEDDDLANCLSDTLSSSACPIPFNPGGTVRYVPSGSSSGWVGATCYE